MYSSSSFLPSHRLLVLSQLISLTMFLLEPVVISLISEIALRTSYPTSKTQNVVSFNAPGSAKGDTMRLGGSNQSGGVLKVAHDLSFSLLAGGDLSLLE